MRKSFVLKLAAWHLTISLQINLFTDNFQEFYVNDPLRLAVSRLV